MTQLTNEMIIKSINKSIPIIKLQLIIFGVMLLVLAIIYFVKFRKEKDSTSKKGIIIATVIVVLLFGVPVFKTFLKYNAIQHSIKNNSFEVVTDTVVRTKSKTNDKGKETYKVYLNNNGKVTVNKNIYYNVSIGEIVYVVLAKDGLGRKYPTGQIYLTSEYQYIDK